MLMAVASMGKSKDVVDRGMVSTIMKYSRYGRCSDTRAFNDVRNTTLFAVRSCKRLGLRRHTTELEFTLYFPCSMITPPSMT